MKHGLRARALPILLLPTLGACAGQIPLPEPRSIVVYSGERIMPDRNRMAEIEQWLTPELERINLDPDFLIRLSPVLQSGYPWDSLEITGDTADLRLAATAPDGETPFLVYGYLRLMDEWDTLEEVLPEAIGLSGYEVEKAIVQRVAEVWLLGRSVFDTQPFAPLDELIYATQAGHLDDFILATQGERFAETADAYRVENPGSEAAFRSWFERTFGVDGPQFIRPPGSEEPAEDTAGDPDPPC